jgi:hypothetical protein
MMKSPTENELVALMDNLSLADFFHEFLEFLNAGPINKHIIFQDFTAAMPLVTNGEG